MVASQASTQDAPDHDRSIGESGRRQYGTALFADLFVVDSDAALSDAQIRRPSWDLALRAQSRIIWLDRPPHQDEAQRRRQRLGLAAHHHCSQLLSGTPAMHDDGVGVHERIGRLLARLHAQIVGFWTPHSPRCLLPSASVAWLHQRRQGLLGRMVGPGVRQARQDCETQNWQRGQQVLSRVR